MAHSNPSHRSEKRGPSDRIGTIKLGFFKTITCVVDDLSVSGAKLILQDTQKLPEKFELQLSGSGKKRSHKCLKRWEKDNTVGIEFLSSKIG